MKQRLSALVSVMFYAVKITKINNDLSINIMKIANTSQQYSGGKIFISSILCCSKTFANIAKLNEGIKKNKFFKYL